MNWRMMSDFKENNFYSFLPDKMKLNELEFMKDNLYKFILIHNELAHSIK